MKLYFITTLTVVSLFIFACSSSKKTGTSTSTAAPAASLSPGDVELKAIQVKYAEVTLQTLNDGYAIYSGPCTKCHGQKNIFSRSEEDWEKAISHMAPKAKLTDVQKDALWKYILAMKAGRPDQKK